MFLFYCAPYFHEDRCYAYGRPYAQTHRCCVYGRPNLILTRPYTNFSSLLYFMAVALNRWFYFFTVRESNFANTWCNVSKYSAASFSKSYQFAHFLSKQAFLDFENLQFLSCGLCRHAVMLPHTKFRRNRTVGRWVMAKKSEFQLVTWL